MEQVNIFWFRRDLRLQDNWGLCHALQQQRPVLPVFIYDRNILDKLDDPSDARVQFIYEALAALQRQLVDAGASLQTFYGTPAHVFAELTRTYNIEKVFTNHDYEPYAIQRDSEVAALLQAKNIAFKTFKDQVIFEKDEVVKEDGSPYTVFTPYSRKWKSRLEGANITTCDTEKYLSNFHRQPAAEILSPRSFGFNRVERKFPFPGIDASVLAEYQKQRDYPSLGGTSKLGVHLRFGTISIRSLVREARKLSAAFLNELIWREFYQAILWHFPYVATSAFKPAYDHIKWRNNEEEFRLWCEGRTGYPIVDAGMHELNATGFMHNRVRMIVASFLTKHLLIDWRWGEVYFAEKLLDYELASNNGGWQWAAGSGCDAAPYFRIFNPALQEKKFDPQQAYIKKWIPGFDAGNYMPPIVEHTFARKRCLETFSAALRAAR